MQKIAGLSPPVGTEDVLKRGICSLINGSRGTYGDVDLPRVGGGLAGHHVVEVCEYFRFYARTQAEAEEEDAASNRGCEPSLSHLGCDCKNVNVGGFAPPSAALSLGGGWHRCALFQGPVAPWSCPTLHSRRSGSSPQFSAQWGRGWAAVGRPPALPGPPAAVGPCILHGSSPPVQYHINRESGEESRTLV